jgi:hypothetical protein
MPLAEINGILNLELPLIPDCAAELSSLLRFTSILVPKGLVPAVSAV